MQDKESMMRMGFSALMAYGLVSHITYATCIIISWVISGTRSGLSPFARGQVLVQYLATAAISTRDECFEITGAMRTRGSNTMTRRINTISFHSHFKDCLLKQSKASFLDFNTACLSSGGLFSPCTSASVLCKCGSGPHGLRYRFFWHHGLRVWPRSYKNELE
jgi:hypothetical protein